MNKVALPRIESISIQENLISGYKGAILSGKNSPVRFEIPIEAMKVPGFNGIPMTRKVIPQILGSVSGMTKAVKELNKNPEFPKKIADNNFFSYLEDHAKSQGISSIGYTKLPNSYIFHDKAVLYSNAIILTFEMDEDLIEQAPSLNTFTMIHQTYNKLGKATNALANYLRENGFSAHASHPLGGITLYPPLAEQAGLGFHGLHGLIITPEHGPRVRLSAVFTSIENLPFNLENDNSWVYDFCQVCKKCIRTCPGQAILETPIIQNESIITHIDVDKCFPYFLRDHGCTICIKDCPFSDMGYDKIKKKFQRKEYVTVKQFFERKALIH